MQDIARDMKESTRERNHTHAPIAVSLLDAGRIATDINEFTLGRRLMPAGTVTRALTSHQTARNMNKYTRDKRSALN